MRRLLISCAALAWLFALGACDNGGDGTLVPGQTDFINEEPNQHSDGRDDWASPGAQGEYDSSNKAGGAPGAPPQGRTGDVEEADIYRVDNNRLFYLNTYRGFIIYDVNNPKKPKQISRLPVYGYPIEMFVSGTTVYALLRDSLYLTQSQGKLEFKRHNVSQLVAIDISDINNPKVLKTVDIIGKLREGVSRKIEDTIYVVSYIPQYYYWGWGYNQGKEKEQAWVYSFNVKNPKAPQLVQKLKIFEGGSYKIQDPNTGTYLRRYFSNVAISATSNTLMVVENWRKYGWVKGSNYQCSSSVSLQQAVVSLIDISDPKGSIKLHSKFETYGQLGDQFKQTYVFDKTTGKATYYGIFARREWNNQNCTGTSIIQNNIEAWDVTNGNAPVKISSLSFGKPNETVRGSAFDRDRKVAYAITARQIDPLYAISFANPSKLKILSEIDGLSGDMNVFRLVEGGKFLLGIGRDNSQVCDGFGTPGTNWRSTNVAVSVIDVRNVNKIRLVQRQCVAVQNAQWVGSALNWNRDQAHKMIGMHSDGRANVITVPVYYYKKNDPNSGWWWYQRETAVGLMTWNIQAYDDTKDHTQQTVLQNFGTLIHAKGEVKRSIVFTHKGTTSRRKVINLSDTHLSLFDIDDLNNPVQEAVVEVAPYYQQIFRFGNYLVEHVGPRSYYWDYYGDSSQGAKSEFRVKASGGKLEDAKVLATFTAGQVHRVIKHGNKLVLFRYLPNDQSKAGSYYYGYRESEALIYDLSTPTAPVRVGQVKLPANVMPYYWYWCGDFGYRGSYWFDQSSNFISIDGGIVFLTYDYDPATRTSTRKLVFLDMQTPYNPQVRSYALTTASGWSFLSLVPDGSDSSSFYLNYRTYLGKVVKPGGQTLYKYKYFAQQWKTSPQGLLGSAAINLPGRLIRAFKGSWGNTLFLTHDYFYVKHAVPGKTYSRYQSHFRMNLLQRSEILGQPVASLLDSRVFSSFYLKDLVINGDKIVINAHRDYYYQQQNGLDWRDLSDHLIVLDISAGTLKETYSEPTGTYRVNLMGVHKGKLFVNLPGDGILVVDMSKPGQMIGQQFLRTLGWATHLEFANDTMYVAAGHFGVYQMKLQGPVVIPTI